MLLIVLAAQAAAGKQADHDNGAARSNPVTYFEIPVIDMDRAVGFYTKVLGYTLERQNIDGYEMALFPALEGAAGASGALAKDQEGGDVYVPAKTGPVIYFGVTDIDVTLANAVANGGAVLYEKKSLGAAGFVAEIEDSEGNRIALHSRR